MLPESHTRRQEASPRSAPFARLALAATLLLGPNLGPGISAAAAAPLRPAEAIDTHTAVGAWVRALEVPASEASRDEDALPPVWGAGVTLRLDGRVLARASEFSLAGPDAGVIRRTAAAAIREARSKLSVPNDAFAEEAMARLARAITLSLEIFDEPVPIPDADLSMPLAGCSPGAEALVVSVAGADGSSRVLVSGVDAQLTRGADPAREMAALAAELAGDGATALRPIDELLASGFRFARAPVVHLVAPGPGDAPVFLARGSRLVGDADLGTAAVRGMADRLAAHLRGRVWPGVERFGVGGDIRVVTGTPEPMVAPPFEQALVAFALLRHAQLGGPDADSSRSAGKDILTALAVVEPGEGSPWDSIPVAAMAVGGLSMLDEVERAGDGALTALQARALDTLRNAFGPEAGFAPSVPPGGRGLVAWGLVRASVLDASFPPARAEGAVRAAFRDTGRGGLVAEMPFLAWAELELNPAGDLPSAAALDEMRALVLDHQLRRADLRPIDQDLAGGIVFTRGLSALPTWQSMRPLAALAVMLADERLTPGTAASGEVPGQLVRLIDGLRFVRQLAMTGDGLFLAANPAQAAWGVRRGVWEPAVSPEASALALLTTCEAIDAMNSLARRSVSASPDAQP